MDPDAASALLPGNSMVGMTKPVLQPRTVCTDLTTCIPVYVPCEHAYVRYLSVRTDLKGEQFCAPVTTVVYLTPIQ